MKNVFSEVFKVLCESIAPKYRHISELTVFQKSWRESCVNEIHRYIVDKNLLSPFVLLMNSPVNHSILQLLRDIHILFPVDTGRKLNVHKTFRRRPGLLLNVLCMFNLRHVSLVLTTFRLQVFNTAKHEEVLIYFFLKKDE